jgi:hypothetical protein
VFGRAPVVRGAEHTEVVRLVGPTQCERLDVVDLQVARGPAARAVGGDEGAAMVVAIEDGGAGVGGDSAGA